MSILPFQDRLKLTSASKKEKEKKEMSILPLPFRDSHAVND
jgi:hypothetical protein